MGEGKGRYFRDLWIEFEEKQMYKAKVVTTPDKVAAPQYNEANLDAWQLVEHE